MEHADGLKHLVLDGMTMAEMALRFILRNETVRSIIPGMRKAVHVESDINTSTKI